jgi:hypothetical protein
MKKIISLFLIISVVALSLTACTKKVLEEKSIDNPSEITQEESSKITGDISAVESIDSDLEEFDLEEINSELDNVNW